MSKYNYQTPNILRDVQDFFFLAQPELIVPPFQRPPYQTIDLAIKLIHEEVNEELIANLFKLKSGYSIELAAKVLDDCVDSVYVIIWTTIALNLPFNPMWNEVQKKNMEKFPICSLCFGHGCEFDEVNYENNDEAFPIHTKCNNGRIIQRNKNGKVIKPIGWIAPNSWDVLYEAWNSWKLRSDKTIIASDVVNGEYYGQRPKR